MTIPIPADLVVPEVADGELFELPVTFALTADGNLEVVQIDGVDVAEPETVEEEIPAEEDFMSAVNRQLV